MSERSNLICKLQSDFKVRAAYIQAKVGTLVPSQIRALRMKSATPRQPDLASAAEMYQSRISALETAGANPTLATLSSIAAALKVGLKVEFVPFSEMLAWENNFSQDQFDVVKIDSDVQFLNPTAPLELATPPVTIAAMALPAPQVRLVDTAGFSFSAHYNFGSPAPIEPEQVLIREPVAEPMQDLWGWMHYQSIPMPSVVPTASWSDIGYQA